MLQIMLRSRKSYSPHLANFRYMKSTVVVIGSANMDLIMSVDHLPVPGETVGGGQYYQKPGGKGANQAVAAARAGVDTAFIGAVGDDDFGRELIRRYEVERIDTRHMKISTQPTGVALINVDRHGENSISVGPGANADLNTEEILKALKRVGAHSVVILQNEIPVPVTQAIIQYCHKAGIKVLYNPAPFISMDESYFNQVAYLILNQTEARDLLRPSTSLRDEELLHQLTLTLSTPYIILTLGSDGVIYYDRAADTTQRVPAIEVKVVDTTGAGDTFCGYLGAMIIDGASLRDAVEIAVVASGLSVQGLGAQESIPHIRSVNTKRKG